jgi:hypothetical protein
MMVNRIYWFILIKTCAAQKLSANSVFHNKMLFRFIAPQKNNNNKTTKKQQTNKSTSQYVLNTTMRKQAQIT